MISNLDYNIFKAIEQDKKLTEIYLGHQSFEWLFTKAEYSATHTEAVEFTLFDKTICALLNIEDSLSLEDIGDILGFNVIDNSSLKKYKDFAEYEILKDALQVLEDFEMITTGDNSYSYCQLTPIGKEYFQKGKKFKVHPNKRFELYFDNTNNDHSKAKENFEFLNSVNIEENSINAIINYEDEKLLKTFSENQIPEIYNVEKMNSFKDSELLSKEHKSITLHAVCIVDTISGEYKTVVYEEVSKKTYHYFSLFLKKNKKIEEELFYKVLQKQRIHKRSISDDSFLYRKELIKSQKKIDHIIKEDKNVSEKLTSIVNEIKFIEPFMFINKLDTVINASDNEVWLMFNNVSLSLIEKLTNLIKNIKDKYIFISLPIDPDFKNELDNFKNKVSETSNSYLIIGNIDKFNIITESSNKKSIYKKIDLPLIIVDELIEYQFIEKCSNIDLKEYLDDFRLDFANEYVSNLTNKINSDIIEKITSNDLSTYTTQEIEYIDFKIRPFYNVTKNDLILAQLKENKTSLLNAVKTARKEKIESFIHSVSNELKTLELSEEGKFQSLKSKINKEKKKVEETESNLFLDAEKKFSLKEKEFELIKKRKSIIIDTNILIEEPKIIDIIGSHQNIIFSAKVIDELDGLKNRSETKEKAQQAIREIYKYEKNRNIHLKFSKVELLPIDFEKNSPDNMILSVALQYLEKTPILLTNDKGLMLKSESLNIPAKTIAELTSLLSLSKRNRTNNRKKR